MGKNYPRDNWLFGPPNVHKALAPILDVALPLYCEAEIYQVWIVHPGGGELGLDPGETG